LPRSFSVIIILYDYYFEYACTHDAFIRSRWPVSVLCDPRKNYTSQTAVIIITCVKFKSIIQSEHLENFSTTAAITPNTSVTADPRDLFNDLGFFFLFCFPSLHCCTISRASNSSARVTLHIYTVHTLPPNVLKTKCIISIQFYNIDCIVSTQRRTASKT